MFDVFYSGKKPGLFAHEQAADTIDHAGKLSRTRYFWWVNYLTDYTGFDFLFEPVPWQRDQRHAWASQWQKDSGTYLIPRTGYTDTNYRIDCILNRLPCQDNWTNVQETFDYSWHPDPTEPPLVYQFGTQWQKTGGPTYHVAGAVDTKYLRTPQYIRTKQDINWIVPDNVDTESFDFTWHPDATDPPYNYQFGTQHQRTGGPQYIMPGATDIKFVDQIKIRTQRTAQQIYIIDHLNDNASTTTQIKNNIANIEITTVRYFDNYLDTLKRIARRADNLGQEFVWICSTICDYANFDFSWHPEQWQAGMLHVFASDNNKFGDTFFMHVPTFAYRADQIELLDWYDINYVGLSVPRGRLPVIQHKYSTQVEAVQNITWAGPLAVFSNQDNITINDIPAVSLWREKTKTVVPLSSGAGTCIVPKTSVSYIQTQLYDYPYIDRTQRHMYSDTPLDIVFIDNGEHNADYNYLQLPHVSIPNKIHRSSGVKGRAAAYHAAAKLSTTTWFFAVFAKLIVNPDFDWTWQPDRLQEPKHYIFHAKNPVNGLEYGHMSMIAYNKKLVLENTVASGLDFTLDQAHEVIPILSGTAEYHNDIWTCWRTAFRECIKLKDSLPNVENEYRLNQWLTKDNTEGQWSLRGATDAVEYYDAVNGDFTELKKSYEWDWLNSYAMLKYGSMWNRS
jgi:hypothetical protein